MTQFYIGTKCVEAWPQEHMGAPGYAVKYPDGYHSWSPKDVFEAAYLSMGMIGPLANTNRITLPMVEDFIVDYHDMHMGTKTTVVTAICRNGFEVTETASCVDPLMYDHAMGIRICKERIRDKVWSHLGFLLQTALNGVTPKAPRPLPGTGGDNLSDPDVPHADRRIAPTSVTTE